MLEATGPSTIFHLGPLGSGAAMKLAVNTVIFGLNEALAEALVLAEAAPASTARPRTTSWRRAPSVRRTSATSVRRSSSRTTPPVAFSLDLAAKDLRPDPPPWPAELGVRGAAGRDQPGGRSARRRAQSIAATADFSAVADHLVGRSG